MRDAFVEGLGDGAVAGDEVAALLAEHLRVARQTWPGITVAPARFAKELGRRIAAMGEKAVPLAAIKAADIYVATACLDGDAAAIEAVRRVLTKEVEVAGSRSTPSRDQRAEVTANLSRILFVAEPPRAAALHEYSGRGDLKSYLRVMAMREVARIVNLGRREVGVDDQEVMERLVPASDPELRVLRDRYREPVDAAIRAALETLDERGRALLRFAIVDGLSVGRVGELYNVHKATAARWIAAAREQLGEAIRVELGGRLQVPEDEITSIIRLVQSRVDVSLDRVLAAP